MSENSTLSKYLKLDGVRLTQVASDLNVDRTTLWRWAKNGVPLDRLADVSAATGISPATLRPDLAAQFTVQPSRRKQERVA